MDSGPNGDIQVILCTIAYRDRLLDYGLDVAVALGFDGVEIWGREPHISEQFDENRIQAVRRMVQQRQLAMPVLGSYLRFGATKPRIEDNIELEDVLHTAHCLDTRLVRVWVSDVGSAEATEAVWQTTIQEIRQACEQAGKLGITFIAEMHSGTLADTGPTAKRLVKEVGHENFRLNYQAATQLEPQTPLERLQMVLPYVRHMHAQNYQSLESDSRIQRVALGQGVIDYASLVGQLKQVGYQGCIAVEFSWAEGEEKQQAIAADLEFLRTLIGSR